ncbi:MAG: ABC transporter substrate-binding protein [Halothiobacillaceae bacterium]
MNGVFQHFLGYDAMVMSIQRTPMHTLSRRGFLIKLAAFALLFGGCTPRPPLRVAVHARLGYEPMFLARQHGWLEAGFVRLVETPSATDSLRLIGSGLVEAAALTLDEVLRARALGLPLIVPMVLDISLGADGVLARHPMHLAELAGLRIGVEQSAVGALMLTALLEHGRLEVHQVQPVTLDLHEHATAWRAGHIDALITAEPTLSALEAEGAVRIFDSRLLPDTIIDVLAVQPSAFTHHPAAVQQLLEATLRAVHDLNVHRMDAAYRIGARLRQRPERVLAGLRGLQWTNLEQNRRLLGGAHPLLIERARKVAAILQGAGILPADHGILEHRLFNDLVHAEYLPIA